MENKKVKILAVDDNRDNLVILQALLADAFHDVAIYTAKSGKMGLDLAAAKNPDVILLDIVMPGMDGFEVCRKLKADKLLRDIPVVFVTANKGDKQSRILALEAGAEAFLSKPIDESELTAQIRAMLKIRAINIQKRNENIRLEKISQENAYRFQSMFNHMPSGAAIYKVLNDGANGKDYIVMDFNKTALQIEGKKKNEVLGKSLHDLRPNIDEYGLISAFQKAWQTGKPVFFPARVYIDEKFNSWYENRIYKLPSGEIIAIYDDVTEKILAQEKLQESERKYRQISENISDVIWTADLNMRTTYISSSVQKMIGESPEAHLARTLEQKFTPDSIKEINAVITEELAKEKDAKSDKTRTRIIECEHYRADGNVIWVSMHVSFLRDENGKVIGFQGVSRDITVQKQMEESLRQSERKYSSYIESAPDGVFVTDEFGRYIEVNKAAVDITGYSKEQLLRMTIRDITPVESLESAENHFNQLKKEGFMNAVLQYKHGNGTNRWWAVNAVKLSDHLFLGFSKDVTKSKKAEEDLVYLSYHDQLTGLYNRRFFEEELKRLDTQRNLPLSIIMADVNGLKLINDSFGHATGDELLKKVSHVIRRSCRSDDIIARLGGDEFVIILPKTDISQTEQLVARLESMVSQEKVKPLSVSLSVSFGYETKKHKDKSIHEILISAENHMYRHKVYEAASMRNKTIEIVMNTLFEKSNREMMHSRRVSQLCEAIAQRMQLDRDSVSQVKIAGLVHDIGKIGIDEKILNNPNELSFHEWVEMKKHPESGWRILASATDFAELAVFVLAHHERWDGKGYPNGLKGSAIPLESRIIALADSFDVMTSERPYRKAYSKEEAITEIMRCSGKQFDPDIVRACIDKL